MINNFLPPERIDNPLDSRILIVDEHPNNIQDIAQSLAENYKIYMATSGQQAIEVCLQNRPDLVLMDALMSGMDGLNTCKKMKQDPYLAGIPVIFLTPFEKPDHENACWEVGGIDLLYKPINPITLHNRVKAHLQSKLQTELLCDLVYRDSLTCIYNRRYFDDYYLQQYGLAQRTQKPLALLMIDVDFFKQYNDLYGHVSGDKCLKRISKCLQSMLLRPTDVLARYGGEEFVCVLPETNTIGAKYIANELIDAIQKLAISHQGSPTNILTISIGAAVLRPGAKDNLIQIADEQLYKAKDAGRNCCMGME